MAHLADTRGNQVKQAAVMAALILYHDRRIIIRFAAPITFCLSSSCPGYLFQAKFFDQLLA
jgi:hypothetical protein